jgi:hypothetical protein
MSTLAVGGRDRVTLIGTGVHLQRPCRSGVVAGAAATLWGQWRRSHQMKRNETSPSSTT